MAFEVIAASYREREKRGSPLKVTLASGLTFGGVVVFAAGVGILGLFNQRWIVSDTLALGHALMIFFALWAGQRVAAKSAARSAPAVAVQGFGAGAVAGATVAALVIAMTYVNLRFVFVNFSPVLLRELTFGLGSWTAAGLLVLVGGVLGLAAALVSVAPEVIRRPSAIALAVTTFIGLFQELLQLMIQHEWLRGFREFVFTWDGLRLPSAITIFVVVAAGTAVWMHNRERVAGRFAALPASQRKAAHGAAIALGLLALFLIPAATGNFLGQVFMMVGLFTLMGMGLNLELGLAGLLDLGFVAFFAVGAYTIALLTADSPYALAQLSFWQALPVAVLLSVAIGVLFGVPVLKVRGDYLAVATLGLGEIVRVIVISDAAQPLLGGAQGVLNIPRPSVGTYDLDDPVELFYLTLACAGVAAFFAYRLENSRLGRAWTAIRDDEDVAQALGINLVNVKLLAYGLGAAFAGVAGAIFAAMLGSVYPHSFQLLISVNVLALLIVGGMGSLPGVVVGATALIGLPEMLREFGEFRFLFYGIAIVAVMRLKPEGLWPSAAKRRELRIELETREAVEAQMAAERAASPAGGSRSP